MVIQSTRNLRIEAEEDIVAPLGLLEIFPLTTDGAKFVKNSRDTIKKILDNEDSRLMVVVGPCSIHDPKAALEYARWLVEFQKKVADQLFLVMRVYFEKPRTIVGWKGLINDPDMDGSRNINKGIRIARKLFCDITKLGVPIASEMLDPITPQYLSDFISWGAIGARTTESQTHRELASGLSFPIGFKNGTDGDLQIAIDAMGATMEKHSFLGMGDYGMTKIIRTSGNPDVHIVLRGGKIPNYNSDSIRKAREQLRKNGFLNTGIMVDCSHANSHKNHIFQKVVLENVVDQVVAGDNTICALMIESNINEKNQKIPKDLSKLKYGVSVTDKCISIEETELILLEANERLNNRSSIKIPFQVINEIGWSSM